MYHGGPTSPLVDMMTILLLLVALAVVSAVARFCLTRPLTALDVRLSNVDRMIDA